MAKTPHPSFENFNPTIDENKFSYSRENFLKLIAYTEYLKGEVEGAIEFAEYVAKNFNTVVDYLNLKHHNEMTEYFKMRDDNKSDIEINAMFRKNKIKNLLDPNGL
jgi:hypothetical protein